MPRKRSASTSYQQFEQRRMLASVSEFTGSVDDMPSLNLRDYAQDEVLSVSQSGDFHIFRLINGDTWTGDPIANVSGIGSSTIRVVRDEFASVNISDDADNRTLDVVFATDIDLSPTIFSVESVSQVAGTAVNLTAYVDSKSIVLTEPGNAIDTFLTADFVRLESDNPIEILSAIIGSGHIKSLSSVTSFDTEPSFSTNWIVSGTLSIEAGTFIDIHADKFGVTGRMNLDAPEGIKIRSTNIYEENDFADFNGFSKLAQLNFNTEGTFDIEMTHNSGPFNGANRIPIHLVGQNTARDVRFIVPDASFTDAANATLNVSNGMEVSANNVYLANHPDNVISVGNHATFRGLPQLFDAALFVEQLGAVFFADAGDVRFGSFSNQSTNFFTLHEDDSTRLLGVGADDREFYDTQYVRVKSAGDLEIGSAAIVESKGWMSLQAEGKLVSLPGGSSSVQARAARFAGDESIELDRVEAINLEYVSSGDVDIHSTSNITLRGNNRGQNVLLATPERIASADSTFVSAENLTMSGLSVWVGNRDGEIFQVRNRLTLLAADGFVIVGEKSPIQAARLNVQAGFAKVHVAGSISFVGDNRMTTGRFFALSNFTDALTATLQVDGQMELQTPGAIYLGDGDVSENRVYFCGHTIFDAEGFVSVHRNGDVVLGSWNAESATGTWINPDRRSCEA